MQWIRKAAEQGLATAQSNLAGFYIRGEGVQQDLAEATLWLRRAAEGGNMAAQLDLGSRYALGTGVPQDFVQAHKWLNLAFYGGSDLAEAVLDQSERISELGNDPPISGMSMTTST